MKTGQVAALFKKDPKTITKWVDTYTDYFSEEARKGTGGQRIFDASDLIVINTLKLFTGRGYDEQEIHIRLQSGERETALPPDAQSIDGMKAVAVFTEMSQLKVENRAMREDLTREREESRNKDVEIARLNREVGKWQALYEFLKEQGSDD